MHLHIHVSQGRVVNVVNTDMVRQFREDVEQEFGDTLQILVRDIASLFYRLSAKRDVKKFPALNFSALGSAVLTIQCS